MRGILPVTGASDPVVPRRLEHLAGLRRGDRKRLHHVDGAVRPLADRRRVRDLPLRPVRLGLVFYLFCRFVTPGAAFFKKQTLTRSTPTLVPDEELTWIWLGPG